MSNKSTINILHLSDIHFGVEEKRTGIAKMKNVLRRLVESLEGLPVEWRPQVVAFSGDVAQKAIEEDYRMAAEWFRELLDRLGLTVNELLLCPGNHDVNQNEVVVEPPSSAKEADELLDIDSLEGDLSKPFEHYMAFCREMGIPPYDLASSDSYLTGCREVKGINFICLNSAWFFRLDNSENLWLGQPLIEVMEAEGQFENRALNVALFHHPTRKLTVSDGNNYHERRSAFRHIAEKSNIILTGDLHNIPQTPSFIEGSVWHIEGGATYGGSDFSNHCSIIKVDRENNIFSRNLLEYTPGKGKWESTISENEYNLATGTINISRTPEHSPNKKEGSLNIGTINNTNSPTQIGNNNTQNITYNN